MIRAFSTKEVLLGIVVLMIAFAVVAGMALSIRSKQEVSTDIERMRHVYLSLAQYESDHDEDLPPTLVGARAYVPDDIALLSTRDPFRSFKTDGFPNDGSLPDWNATSPVRISYAYLYAFAAAGKAKPKQWSEQKYYVKVGLLADEWLEDVTPGQSFHAQVGGPIHRLNTDGALHIVPRTQSEPLGDAENLFFSTEKG